MDATHQIHGPYIYVDDLLILSVEQGCEGCKKAINATFHYIEMRGAKDSPEKSHLFASTPEVERELGNGTWEIIGKKLKVVDRFKYLGAQVSCRHKMARTEMDKRMINGISMAGRLSRIGLTMRAKIKAIVTNINPAVMFGVDNSNPSRKK